MRRRLTLALVGFALLSIVLLGFGILAFSQIGARSEARDQVRQQLDAVLELSGPNPEQLRLGPSLGRLARAFGIDDLSLTVVETATTAPLSGAVYSLPGPNQPDPKLILSLTKEEIASLNESGTLEIDRGRQVGVISLIEVPANERADLSRRGSSLQAGQPAILIRQTVAPVARSALRWFMVSALVVLGLSVLLGDFLAKRLVAPLRQIEETTVRLAAGQMDARADSEGEDEIAGLGRAVNKMASDLARSRRLEQQFLLSVSHDLRTPLTVIRGYAEALSDGMTNDAPAAGRTITRHANRLDRLVRDLLDLARLDANAFEIVSERLDLAAITRHSIEGFAPIASSNQVALTLDLGETTEVEDAAIPCWVYADADRVAQILSNLIENGLKYAHSAITVSILKCEAGSAAIDKGGCAAIDLVVADDGPGISAEDLPHIFERLYVTQQEPERSEASSGLGLAIVKELATAMGGSVRARAKLGHGTAITVSLPTTAAGLPRDVTKLTG